MKIYRKDLKQIVKEELLKEGFFGFGKKEKTPREKWQTEKQEFRKLWVSKCQSDRNFDSQLRDLQTEYRRSGMSDFLDKIYELLLTEIIVPAGLEDFAKRANKEDVKRVIHNYINGIHQKSEVQCCNFSTSFLFVMG